MHLPNLVSAIALLPAVSEASQRGNRAERLPVHRTQPDEHASRAKYDQRQPFRDPAVKIAADSSSSIASSSSAAPSEAALEPSASSVSSSDPSSASASSSLYSQASMSFSEPPSPIRSSQPFGSGRPHFFPLHNGTFNGTAGNPGLNGTGTGFSSSLPTSSGSPSALNDILSPLNAPMSAPSGSLSAPSSFQSAFGGFQPASSDSLPAPSGPSCTFSVVTLTETVEITVSVTASWFDHVGRPWFGGHHGAPLTASPLDPWSHGKRPEIGGSIVDAIHASDPASWSSHISQSGYSASSAAPLTASPLGSWASHGRHPVYNASGEFPLNASSLGSWSHGNRPESSGSIVDAIYASAPASWSYSSPSGFNASGKSPLTASPLGSWSYGKRPSYNGSSVEAIAASITTSGSASIEQSSFSASSVEAIAASITTSGSASIEQPSFSASSVASFTTSDPASWSSLIRHSGYNASRKFPLTASPLGTWLDAKRPEISGSIVDAMAASAAPSLPFNISRPGYNASGAAPLSNTASYPLSNSSAVSSAPSSSDPCDEFPDFTTPPVYPTPSSPGSKADPVDSLSRSVPTREDVLPFDPQVTNVIYGAGWPTASFENSLAAAQSALPVSWGSSSPADPYHLSASTLVVSIKRVTGPVTRLAIPPTSTHTWWTTLVIDPAIAPVTTATLAGSFASTVSPSKTVCATNAPIGTPEPDSAHCGVHGKPVGDFFIGEFVQNKEGVPVTLEGCFQFCTSIWGTTHGCQSYDYYINSLGAPRCMLYGSPVAYALDEIDNLQPDTWFDMECGDPMSSKWAAVRSSSNLMASLVSDA